MQAIKAIYDGASFTPTQPVPVQGHYDVIITFVKPINLDTALGASTLPRVTAKGMLQGMLRTLDDFNELEAASISSTAFWYNDVDDEVWNNA